MSILAISATKSDRLASHLREGTPVNPTLKLLKAKRSSALKDARKMETELARLNKEAEAAGITTNLRCIVRMFQDHIAALDEAIKSARSPRTSKNQSLSA
jgi:hypothetical protein